jgi:hypothetical protein
MLWIISRAYILPLILGILVNGAAENVGIGRQRCNREDNCRMGRPLSNQATTLESDRVDWFYANGNRGWDNSSEGANARGYQNA